jgi:APA family basic amino acid/polyamine antiporter
MIGAGIFLSTGFMVQTLRPGEILLAWGIGAVLALCGVRAYGAVAVLVPESGGEYRYLSTLLHSSLGFMAGWTSLLIGFSAPMAIDALAVGAFAETLRISLDPRVTATGLILILTTAHAFQLRASLWTQNCLVALKVLLLLCFIALGLALGSWEWPTWSPPQAAESFPLGAFINNLFFIMFAFSGWNAAVYAAGEFRNPRRDIPRAMLIGCLTVTAIYLVITWIFLANLNPDESRAIFDYESTRVTLGHLVVHRLAGPLAAAGMSVVMILVFISALSAMMLLGPRVCSAMACDGFLPRLLAGTPGRPPRVAVFVQSALSILLIWTHSLTQLLLNLGAILTLFAAMTSLLLFRVTFDPKFTTKPRAIDLVAAGVYAVAALIMLYFGLRNSLSMLLWIAGLTALACIFHETASRERREW